MIRSPITRTSTLAPSREPKPARGSRMRKCSIKECRTPFAPMSMSHKVCSPACALIYAKALAVAKERKTDRARKVALRSRKWYLATLKTAMHAFVRARDEGKQCASCDTILIKLGRPGGDYDAGHFRSVGSAAHLRFDERNIWGQCKHCNDAKTGNPHEYERRLRLREGDKFVDDLLADQAPRKHSIADLEAMTAHYRAKLKQLKEAAC